MDSCASRFICVGRRASHLVCATTTESRARAGLLHAILPCAGYRHKHSTHNGELFHVECCPSQSGPLLSVKRAVASLSAAPCTHISLSWLLAQVAYQHSPGGIDQLYLWPRQLPDHQGTLSQRQAYTEQYQVGLVLLHMSLHTETDIEKCLHR